jgi:phytanoyl-CoA hydroxylase
VVKLFRRGGDVAPVQEPTAAQAPSAPDELDALLPQAQFPAAALPFRGHFEGLWTDRLDAEDLIRRRLRSGQITDSEASQLEHWVEKGYVILPGAVSADVCEQIKSDLARAFAEGDERLRVLNPGEHFGQPLQAGTDMRRRRVQDIYVYFESARKALFSERIARFLSIIFDAPPLLLQSLTFDSGSRQGVHQDTAYVVIDPPLALAASWTALEDVRPGSGELVYYEGSHRLPDFLFSGAYKCWHPERDGSEQHDEYANGLNERAAQAGLELKRLLIERGDTLIWSGDLAHGGGEVVEESLTRRSLVGHYCPEWAVPRYFDQFPDHSATRRYGGGLYASTHYPLPSED